MPGVPPSVGKVLVAAVATVALLSACTASPTVAASPEPSAPASASSAAPTPSSSRSASAGTPSPSAPSSSATDADADAVTLDIRIADDQVSPNGKKVNVGKGQTVILTVTSDVDDEIHAHTGGDGYELEVRAGKPATGRFVAGVPGSFEVESHHLEKIIAVLVVR